VISDMQFFEACAASQLERGMCAPADVEANRTALQTHLDNGGTLANFPGPPDGPNSGAEQQASSQHVPVGPADQAFVGPTSPAEYRFGAVAPGVETSLGQEITIRSLFHQHEIPAALGCEVGRLWNQACANPPDAVALEVGRQKCDLTLQQAWGDGYEKNLAVAQREVFRMAQTNPEIVGMLEASGLGNNAWLIQTIFNIARARGRA
jgi:hypothetical protein